MRALAALLALLLLAVPPIGASPEGAWAQADPSGDVSPIGGPVGLPLTAATSAIDITGMRIENEDEVGFDIVVQVAELRVADDAFTGFDGINFDGTFHLAGAKPTYRFYSYIYGSFSPDATSTFTAAPDAAYAYFYVCDRHCIDDELTVTLDDAANTVRFTFSKAGLLGEGFLGDEPSGLPTTLAVGDLLTDLRIESQSVGPVFSPLYDSVPDEGNDAPPYAFKTPAANTVVVIELPGTYGGLAVLPGVNLSVPFSIVNRAEGKRLLEIEYVLTGAAAGNYAAWGPRALTIPAGEARNFTLAIDTKAAAKAADDVRLAVRAKSPGRPDEMGYAAADLVPGATLSPASNVLHFHSLGDGAVGQPLDTALCANPVLFGCNQGFLSPLEQDPDATGDGSIQGYGGFSATDATNQFWIPLRRPLPTALAFAEDAPMQLELQLKAPVRAEGVRIEAEMWYSSESEGGSLLSVSTTATIDPAGTLVKLSGPAEVGDSGVVPAGSFMYLRLDVSSFLSPSGTAAWGAGGITISAAESRIVLPLVELPESLRNVAKATPFQLAVVGDDEEFVNPGEARLMNVTILNQASDAHRADVTATIDRAGWSVEVFPGRAYDLDAADMVKLAVLVHAPADAKEAEQGLVRLNVTDETGANATLLLLVTATDGFDFRDDSLGFDTDADARAKLAVPKGKDTPGFHAAFAALAVLGLAFVWRRRKA